MNDFNKTLDFLNPTFFVNDKNYNDPLKQLLENDEYVLKFLNGNRLVLKSFLGNLLDYNKDGEKILSNGGQFDSYKKCQTWKALKNFAINNDEDILFDATEDNMVYVGYSDTPMCDDNYNINRDTWMEREVFVPEILRGQQLVFGMKAATFPTTSGWDLSGSASMPTSGFETVAVEILNGDQTVKDFKVVGPWAEHDSYETVSGAPQMISAYFTFRTKPSSKFVKIKIFRTANSNYLHINKMFLGALTLPYDNAVESFDLENIDISNFYDFDNDVAKVTSTSVLGHTVAGSMPKLNDLVTLFSLNNQIAENWLSASSITGSPTMLPEHGIINLNSSNQIYTIHHQTVNGSSPQVSLILPNSGSIILTVGIFNVQPNQFSVVLSALPGNNSYQLSWFVPTIQTVDVVSIWTNPTPVPVPTPTTYPDIFDFDDEF